MFPLSPKSPMKNRRIPAQSGIVKQSLGSFFSFGLFDGKTKREKDRKMEG